MAKPIIELPRGVPNTDRGWLDVFAKINKFLKVVGDKLQIGGEIELPALSVGTPELKADAVTNDKLRDSAALSLIGQPANSGGNPTDIIATVSDTFMVRRGSALTWDALSDSDIPSSIARDSEVAGAIAAHEAASDPHPGYITAAELATALTNITSGTYTPTLTNVTNLDASTAYACQYMRVGSVVTVSGVVDVDPTATAATELGISLPIASAFTVSEHLGGVAFSGAVAGMGAAIAADATNDRASLTFVATDTTNRAMRFTFTYRVI